MAVKVFIDTNIFVGYLLLSGIAERKTEEEKKKLWKQYKGIQPSYEFMLNLFKLKNKKARFVTSPLVISEIFNVLHYEAICKKMWSDGVPLSSWWKKQKILYAC